MPDILTNDNYLSSQRQPCELTKTGTLTTIAGRWFTMFHIPGSPGAGVLAGGETTPPANTVGRVPTNTIPGYPILWPFGGSAIGRFTFASHSNTIAGSRIRFYDRLWVGGPYAFGATVAITPPSYSSRVPIVAAAPRYEGLQLWYEQVTAGTGIQSVNVTYTDQSGVAGKTTGVTSIGVAGTVGLCQQLPVASGSSGLQAVTNTVGSVATAGTYNLMVLRPLHRGFVQAAGDERPYDYINTGLRQVWATSAIYMLLKTAAGVSSGSPELEFEVASL